MDLPQADYRRLKVTRGPTKEPGAARQFLDLLYRGLTDGWIQRKLREPELEERRRKWQNRRPDPNRRVADSKTVEMLDEIERAILEKNRLEQSPLRK